MEGLKANRVQPAAPAAWPLRPLLACAKFELQSSKLKLCVFPQPSCLPGFGSCHLEAEQSGMGHPCLPQCMQAYLQQVCRLRAVLQYRHSLGAQQAQGRQAVTTVAREPW